ncbi:MAG: lipoprotein signal peptidase [Deltaproteobacteria bacterium]|nr:lipoprotein signal peptidase [Deltaproteobacteria bacterium]
MPTWRPHRAVIFVAMLVLTLAVDQSTKVWARTLPVSSPGCGVAELAAHRCGGVPQPVIAGYWDWELAVNDGAAFSSFRGSRIVLTALAMVALVSLGIMAARTKPEQRMKQFALAAIAGGALGNLIDRVRDGGVTDFVRWHIEDHRWPVFNVADVALVIGVAVLLLDGVLARRRTAALAT